mgnify:CR=1 FL=1
MENPIAWPNCTYVVEHDDEIKVLCCEYRWVFTDGVRGTLFGVNDNTMRYVDRLLDKNYTILKEYDRIPSNEQVRKDFPEEFI